MGIHEAMGAKFHPIPKARIQSRIPWGVVLFQLLLRLKYRQGAMGEKFLKPTKVVDEIRNRLQREIEKLAFIFA